MQTCRFVPGREIRVIPRGWQHPRREGGRYQPLLPADYAFDDDQERWPQMPDASRLPEGETEIAAYEAVSEGTPISPAFPNTPEGRRALVALLRRALHHLRPQPRRCRGLGGNPLRRGRGHQRGRRDRGSLTASSFLPDAVARAAAFFVQHQRLQDLEEPDLDAADALAVGLPDVDQQSPRVPYELEDRHRASSPLNASQRASTTLP